MYQVEKQIRENIYQTVDIILEERLKSLSFNYILEGTIISKNKDNSYEVKINDDICTLNKFDKENTIIYQKNDVIYILVMNN